VQKPVKPEVLYEILRYVLSDDPNAVGSPVALAGRTPLMRMELIQRSSMPRCGLAESLQAPTKIVDLEMDEEAYRRKGVAR